MENSGGDGGSATQATEDDGNGVWYPLKDGRYIDLDTLRVRTLTEVIGLSWEFDRLKGVSRENSTKRRSLEPTALFSRTRRIKTASSIWTNARRRFQPSREVRDAGGCVRQSPLVWETKVLAGIGRKLSLRGRKFRACNRAPFREGSQVACWLRGARHVRFRHSYDFAMSSYTLRNRLRIIGG
jgi:hypothetical protein